jgi:predicted N-formylglutamate amidohydrolase
MQMIAEDVDRIRRDAVHVTPARGGPPLIILCEHASYRIPDRWNSLGLTPAQRLEHIAWDPGAAALALRIASLLGTPAVLAGYSRLFADCNRHPHLPTFVCESSDGISIPGNQGLSEEERRLREQLACRPYQEAVAELLAGGSDPRARTVLLAIHTFVPVMQAVSRPWHLGVLWRDSETLARTLLRWLRDNAVLPDGSAPTIGENQPYSGQDYLGYTLESHAAVDIDTICVEMRHDTVGNPTNIEHWARILASAIATALPGEWHT